MLWSFNLAMFGSHWPESYERPETVRKNKLIKLNLPTILQTATLKKMSHHHPPPYVHPQLCGHPSYSGLYSLHILVLSILPLIKRLFKKPTIGSCQQRSAGCQRMPVASQVSCQSTGLKLCYQPLGIISLARRMCSLLWRVMRKKFCQSRFISFW